MGMVRRWMGTLSRHCGRSEERLLREALTACVAEQFVVTSMTWYEKLDNWLENTWVGRIVGGFIFMILLYAVIVMGLLL